MIQFENVTATYADDAGIFDLSFLIEKGEMVFLMGPTGAGKSTILRTIYKDIELNDGSLYIDEVDVTYMKRRKIPYYRRRIGMIFQDFRLLQDRTVFQNVALPLHIVGLNSKSIKSQVNSILEKVGLDGVKNMLPHQLSGGEQQRVSIARALVKNPIIILADEPTGNLDPNIADDILDLLELATNNGTTVLMSTHNFPLVRPRKKRFIELNNGRLVQR